MNSKKPISKKSRALLLSATLCSTACATGQPVTVAATCPEPPPLAIVPDVPAGSFIERMRDFLSGRLNAPTGSPNN